MSAAPPLPTGAGRRGSWLGSALPREHRRKAVHGSGTEEGGRPPSRCSRGPAVPESWDGHRLAPSGGCRSAGAAAWQRFASGTPQKGSAWFWRRGDRSPAVEVHPWARGARRLRWVPPRPFRRVQVDGRCRLATLCLGNTAERQCMVLAQKRAVARRRGAPVGPRCPKAAMGTASPLPMGASRRGLPLGNALPREHRRKAVQGSGAEEGGRPPSRRTRGPALPEGRDGHGLAPSDGCRSTGVAAWQRFASGTLQKDGAWLWHRRGRSPAVEAHPWARGA